MAASSGRKTSSSNKKTTLSTAKSTGKSRASAQKKKAEAQQQEQDSALFHEIGLIVLFAVMALLFCCNFGLIGPAGNVISGVLFGIFGLTAYVAPVLLFLAAAFWFANEGNPNALRKLIAGIILFLMLGVLCDLFMGQEEAEAGYNALHLYEECRDKRAGGGILAGSIGFCLKNYLGMVGAVLVVLVCSVVCLILLTEKSLIDSLIQGGNRVRELSREDTNRRRESANRRSESAERRRENAERRKEDAERRREQNRAKRQEQEEERVRKEEERRLREEEIENEKILRMEKKVSGVMWDATLQKREKILPQDDMHEIILPEEEIVEKSLQQSRVEIVEEQIAGKQNAEKQITKKQNAEKQIVERQVPKDQQVIKEEKSSDTGQEMSPAFEQWDLPDLPIRIHKEGVEEADVSGELVPMESEDIGAHSQEMIMPEDAGLYGQGTTMPEDTGLYGQGAAMPEDTGSYGQGATVSENTDLYGQGFAMPEDISAYGQNSVIPEDIGAYGQDSAIPEDIGTYGQDSVMPEDIGAYGQNSVMPEDMGAYGQEQVMSGDTGLDGQGYMVSEDIGAYGQSSAIQDGFDLYEQSSVTQNNARTYGQNLTKPDDAKAHEQSSTIQNSTDAHKQEKTMQEDDGSLAKENNFHQASAARDSAIGSTAVQNRPLPVSGAASARDSRPTVAVKPAAGRTIGGADSRMQMEGMPSVGGTQSVMSNGKEAKAPKQYMFPPINLLQKGVQMTGDSVRELKETAMHLQQTLSTFGVKVTITDISQGPSVTRYELQPEQGVKVSKIVSLTDDIKLNLAAMDIRIEAPIPGKAAIGIEVPNKESIPVALRDLLETEEFRNFPSNLAFAVGKDIAGKVVVADIAKMPHMLIAGATGSGKSVCINTLIMGILYKAHPDDVKLIMVDPKVVELSVYNGIPHLLIPVVTDPKKASAALHWGVAEMEDRYRKFAEWNVRDLKGYNKKVEALREKGEPDAPKKLPQIVIIVDELADLMMVCPGEVEESICRLAQLARAAGIHLIIATQRPSVDVITGLIKANMPSRVAFSVSSGVDSRTILDMVGAEKLLGKGDMLFYPQGYAKPARVQGAFVSDNEVSDVVDFMKNQTLGNTYAEEIEEKIKNMGSPSGGASGGSAVDDLFEKAGRLIIDKDKASIGMLQRALQIGFNRAARIMDQLCSYGVVGEEEGTKPRKILMSPEQFEQLLEEV